MYCPSTSWSFLTHVLMFQTAPGHPEGTQRDSVLCRSQLHISSHPGAMCWRHGSSTARTRNKIHSAFWTQCHIAIWGLEEVLFRDFSHLEYCINSFSLVTCYRYKCTSAPASSWQTIPKIISEKAGQNTFVKGRQNINGKKVPSLTLVFCYELSMELYHIFSCHARKTGNLFRLWAGKR